ncbi:MAG: NAD(P)/FAD-dependent oxidoreductase, partial [Candidatus Acidiferrales bacterium]
MTPLSAPNHLQKNHFEAVSGKSPVAIVGGSAAGFFTAYLLAREGVPVRVFEQTETLDPAARTLIVTSRMKDLLREAGSASIVNEIRKFELFTDGRVATIDLDEPDLIIERAKLIRSLADRAQKAGARVDFARKFRNLAPNPNGVTLELQHAGKETSEELSARVVVGGDGAASRVAQSAGWPKPETVPLVQAIVPLPKDMTPDTVRVWFVPADTPYFYWLIPESAERGALGLIGEVGSEAQRHLEAFLQKRKLEAISFQGARIPVYRRWVPVRKKLGGGSVFLVGDAAAQVKVSTVGGIVTGLR